MTTPDELAQRRHVPNPRRAEHWSFADLGGLVALLLFVHVAQEPPPPLPPGQGRHAVLAQQIDEIISSQIRGRVTIGSIERIGKRGVIGRDVVFYDESGHVVIAAEYVELQVDWRELARGHVVSHQGRARGGRIVLETLESGELLIDRAFAAAHPGPRDAPIGPDVVRLERLAISDVDVIIRIHGAPEMRAAQTSGIVLVRAPENGSARMRADRIDAQLHLDSPIPQDLEVDDGHFALDGAAHRRSQLRFPAQVGGEPVAFDVNIVADAHEHMHVEVTLVPQSFAAAFTAAPLIAQASVLETLTDDVDVTVRLP